MTYPNSLQPRGVRLVKEPSKNQGVTFPVRGSNKDPDYRIDYRAG